MTQIDRYGFSEIYTVMNNDNDKINSGLLSWPVIIIVFCCFWPLGLVLLIKRFSRDKTAVVRTSPTVLKVLGIFLLSVGALGLIGFISDADYDVAAMLVCVFFIVGGVMLLRKAKQTQVQADNIKRYISIIVNHNVREIDAISKAMGRPYDDVKSDIQDLINNDFLKNAYINEQTGCVVLASDNVRNEAQPKADLRPRVVTCKCCGAHNTVVGEVGKCEYCDSPIQ